MAVYSVNQATHLYVVAGDAKASGVKTDLRYYEKLGVKGDLTSDKIDVNKIISVTQTHTSKLAPKAQVATVTITGTDADGNSEIDGGTYVMRVIIDNYFSESPSGSYIKHASAYVKNGTTAAALATKLAESLSLGLKRDIEPAFKVEDDGAGKLTITPIATEWVLGRKSTTIPQISVELVPTSELDTEADWGTVAYAAEAPEAGDRELGSEILADYEYFCLGERGDQYRGIGWPNIVETKGLVDAKTDYDIVTVHYYEDLPNEAVQKSEKTAVFCVAGEAGAANAVKTNFTAATSAE